MVQVLPGCEAWSCEGGDVGFLVLHGFTANPSGLRPLAEGLAGHGFAVELPRLPGHGTHWRDLQRTTWCDWVREVTATFEHLKARTSTQLVAGLSLGGALALHLASARPDDVDGLVLINPAVSHKDPRNVLLPLLKHVLGSLPAIANDIAKPGEDERAYDRTPLRATASMYQFWKRLRPRLADVRCPALVFTSRQDHLVDPVNSALILDAISSQDKQQVWLERSYHVATLDYDLPEIIQRSAQFAQRLAGVRP